MATAILLRHGRTKTHPDAVLAGRADVGLDEYGTQQAAAAGRKLAELSLAAVVTSPLRGCAETVEALAAARDINGLVATVEDRLNEFDYGGWQGKHLSDVTATPLWQILTRQPSAAVFPEGGSLAAHAAGAVAAVREWNAHVVRAQGPDAAWLACTHADVIKAIVADALGMHLDLFQRIVVDPGSVTVIRYADTRPYVVSLNDTSDVILTNRTEQMAVVGGGAGPVEGAARRLRV